MHAGRKRGLCDVGDEAGRDAGLALKALDDLAEAG
jgi:hypothetical protein